MLSIGCDARWVTLPSGPVAWQLSPACWAATAVRLHITSSRWMPGCRRSAPVWERTASGTSPMPCCRLGLVVSGGIRGISCCFSCPSGPLWRQRWSGQVCGFGVAGALSPWSIRQKFRIRMERLTPKSGVAASVLFRPGYRTHCPQANFLHTERGRELFRVMRRAFWASATIVSCGPWALGPPGESSSLENHVSSLALEPYGFNVPPGCRCNAPGCLALIQVSQVRLIVVPPPIFRAVYGVYGCVFAVSRRQRAEQKDFLGSFWWWWGDFRRRVAIG